MTNAFNNINNNNSSRVKKFSVLNKYIYDINVNKERSSVDNIRLKQVTKQYSVDLRVFNKVILKKYNIIKVKVLDNVKVLNKYKTETEKFSNIYNIVLNFKKNRFFPYFQMNVSKKVIFNNSLGVISKRFSEKKSYLKSKNSYIMSSSYLRRLLLYISVLRMQMTVIKTPKYLKDILSVLTSNSNSLYKNPFANNELVNEKELNPRIYFEYLVFLNNKALGPIKKKKKGRLKRKISKKIVAYNNILD